MTGVQTCALPILFLLDLTALVAGTQFRGQFESRMKSLIGEIKECGNIMLVIDEVHNLVGAGDAEGSMNAANILKPALSRGEIQVIGATTFNEYRKHIEKDAALERRFQPVTVAEPSLEEAFQIMQGITFIVTHAYHHRFLGEAKYFAPPDFSPRSMLSHAVRPLNDLLAEMSAMMASGKPLYPIALIDPTEDLWRNRFDREPYFEVFNRLNREPWGFTVCDRRRLAEKQYGFRAAIAAGIVLTEEERAAIEANGITVIGADALDTLPALLSDCTVRWAGEGTPHFARRIIDGEEFVFIANIEQNDPICGTLYACGREVSLVLYPGDIRYVSAQYDNIPAPIALGEPVASLPEELPVMFHAPNAVSLEYFTHIFP